MARSQGVSLVSVRRLTSPLSLAPPDPLEQGVRACNARVVRHDGMGHAGLRLRRVGPAWLWQTRTGLFAREPAGDIAHPWRQNTLLHQFITNPLVTYCWRRIHARGMVWQAWVVRVGASPCLLVLRACFSPRTVADFERSIGSQSGKERRPGVGEQGRGNLLSTSFQANNDKRDDKRDEDDAFQSSLRDLARHGTVATKELLVELQVGTWKRGRSGCTLRLRHTR